MKELPKVFENKIGYIDNDQKIFYGNDRNVIKDNININKKINDIFLSSNHVYKSKVRIIMKDKELEKVIVGKTKNNLLTITGELININDIIDIQKI
jgi:hypothetical protein